MIVLELNPDQARALRWCLRAAVATLTAQVAADGDGDPEAEVTAAGESLRRLRGSLDAVLVQLGEPPRPPDERLAAQIAACRRERRQSAAA